MERERRLWPALAAGLFLLFLYYDALDATRLLEVDGVWPPVVVLGLVVVGLCWHEGLRFAVRLMLCTLGFALTGSLLILLAWPFVPLGDLLPAVPEAHPVGWVVDAAPAPSFRKFYSSLCYIVALPLSVIIVCLSHFLAVPLALAVSVILAIARSILDALADITTIFQFWSSH